VCLSVACLKLPSGGGGPSDEGTGGSPGTGGRPGSDVAACAQLFDDACEQSAYDYYLQLCENENAGSVVDILDCAVPKCLTPADESTAECIQLAVEDEQDEDVASLMYDVESVCGSQLDNTAVRIVAIHAASINKHERLVALAECLAQVYCTEIVNCLTEPEVAPWWED
jgi:hypothetical protein